LTCWNRQLHTLGGELADRLGRRRARTLVEIAPLLVEDTPAAVAVAGDDEQVVVHQRVTGPAEGEQVVEARRTALAGGDDG
jgi:hypothetical protein